MGKGRLEAFSDGVLAIIITIMVLELKVPEGIDLAALRPLVPVFLSYALSFVFIAIYWNNHHHLFLVVSRVTGRLLWANMGLLFCLSLVPFGTAWWGESRFAPVPTAVYGVIILAAGMAYWLMQVVIRADDGPDSLLARALGRDLKGNITPVVIVAGIVCSFFAPLLAGGLYVVVAAIWLIPDRRIERVLTDAGDRA